ncbi:hypothetical protein QBC41DRAFT_313593 [Cercophora samala]|uniref:Heterokaryon incompatibility domain-containing protein n=1 Tax=Cercophora samala TaxID=330535 RepID=A0AA39ZKG0_9PEZI|nr:hypothetical protein QBC41DRAFT_313593 [Cercophora samala]
MTSYAEENEYTFTRSRLAGILQKDRKEPLSLDSRGQPLRFIHHSEYIEEYKHLVFEWRELELLPVTEPFAPWLLGKQRPAPGTSAHFELDRANDAIVDWAFVEPAPTDAADAESRDNWKTLPIDLEKNWHAAGVEWVDWNRLRAPSLAVDTVDVEAVVNDACQMLCRLPATPPPFDGSEDYLPSLDQEYFVSHSERTWENLRAVQFFDSNTLRLAMHIAWPRETIIPSQMADAANSISRCLDAARKNTKGTAHGLFLMKTFLWTAWHRITMLHHHNFIGMQLRNPESVIWYPRMGIIGASMMREMSTEGTLESTPSYMCKWAFKLVTQDQASMPPDFRALTQRFSDAFGHYGPRCMTASPGQIQSRQCAGESPGSCMRFKGAIIEDQSAHAAPCHGGCSKLTWDEASYRSLPREKGRAVSLTKTDEKSVRYTSSGPGNMAVSHVWSHGQGGRPEIYGQKSGVNDKYVGGYNSCLHARFKRICQELGCNSYWMDTPCIPQDHNLRREEIAHINDVFLESKVTLVCDRDIMSMDLTTLTLQTMESILATVLVCDWNVRAWTFLEAMRAPNIYLLGRNDTTVRLYDILLEVWRHGDISLGNLFFSTPHLIPTPNYYRASDWVGNEKLETLSVDKAASVLKNRHASRPGDDIVIWSLLCEEKPSHTPEELWISMMENELQSEVSTAFLMSAVPRIQGVPGLSWAPARPNDPGESGYFLDLGNFFTIDDVNCVKGDVTKRGLLAEWRMSKFPVILSSAPSTDRTKKYLSELALEHLKGYRWGAVIQPAQDARSFLDLGQSGNVVGEEPLVAIVGTTDETVEPLYKPRQLGMNKKASKWLWVTVHKWRRKHAELPRMRLEKIWIA